jgi:hypothetical protein
MIGLTGEFSNVWQGKDLGNGQGWEGPLPARFFERYDSKGVRAWVGKR